MPFDVRKDDPYDAYGEIDFSVVTVDAGDCFARYLVRVGEIRESIKIIRQCLQRMPEGDVLAKVPQARQAARR